MLVPRTKPVTFDPNAMSSIDLTPMEPAPAPGMADTVGAAFRQENVVGSILAHQSAGGDRTPDYNPWDDIKGTEYETHWDKFATVGNAGQTAALKRQITQEVEDRNTLAAAGGWGVLATLGASIFSPENLLPGGTIVRGARAGTAIARTALATAGATALGTSLAEVGLMGSQVTRTPTEAAINIGGSALIGGMLGAGVSALFTRADWARLTRQYDQEALAATDLPPSDNLFTGLGSPASAGAAARQAPTLAENAIAGRAASIVGGATSQLNPALRALHSPSPVYRDIAVRLIDNPVYLTKNMDGQTSGPAVENLVKEYTLGAVARATQEANTIFGDFRKTGGQLDRGQFNQAIGQAMRRGDQDANPMVSKAAQAWRSTVFEPLKEAAIKAGLLPADVSVDTALSYFSRVYNRPKIEAREFEFKGIVRQYIAQEVRNAEIKLEVSKLDPRYDAPSKPAPEFLTDADRASYVDEIVNDVFDTITGRNIDGDMPLNIVASTRGPLKERTFSIPDHMIEDFLESDVEIVGRRYSRIMATDIELKTMFGKADLSEQIEAIKQDYQKLRAAASSAGGKPAQIEGQLKKLIAQEKSDIRDLQAMRDMLRNTYMARENSTNYARFTRGASQINYVRTLGGQTLSSITDIARLPMVHGLTGLLRDGLVPLIGNLQSFKMSVNEAKLAGAVTERILNTRMATLAELNDPYSMGSPFERFLDNAANQFSRATGILHWTDFTKSLASVMTQNRILRGVGHYGDLGKRERAYLAFLGVDQSMADRIARQFEAHGSIEDGGVRVASSDAWDDEYARRVYRAAVNRDVGSTIVTKGVGDIPLWMNTPTGRLLGQFKSFSVASNQRVLMRGLQERPSGMVGGTVFATTIGMLIYWLKAAESNRLDSISDNPGVWIAEGLDRSGFLSIAFEINNTVEKNLGIGAYGAFAAAFPGAGQDGKSTRYINRSAVASFTGPTGDLIDTAIRAVQAIKGGGDGFSEGDINSIKRLLPGATLPGIRSLVEYLGVPAVEQAMGVD